MSRQRRWQIKQIENGLCMICANPLATATRCLKCAVQIREQKREKIGSQRRYNSLSYRLENEQA